MGLHFAPLTAGPSTVPVKAGDASGILAGCALGWIAAKIGIDIGLGTKVFVEFYEQ